VYKRSPEYIHMETTLQKKPKNKNYEARVKQLLSIRAKGQLSPRLGKRGKSKETLTKEAAWLQASQDIVNRTRKLTAVQSMLGLGTIQVFRIDGHYELFGKSRKLIKDKPRLIDNIDEIVNVLNYEYAQGLDPSTPDDPTAPKFYFVETKEANNSAIDSQLNRIYGKAKESIDMTSNGQSITPVIVGMRIIDNSKKQIENDDINIIDI
jgi:hypothetical protein